MTTPPTEPNSLDALPVAKPANPGVPRVALLGGAVVLLAGVAFAGFQFLKPADDAASTETVPPPVVTPGAPAQTPPVVRASPKPAVDPAVAASKNQALQALGGGARGPISLNTSFDNVPPELGGTGKRLYAGTTPPVKDNGGKPKPIVQGRLPVGLRSDPFVSRLIIPLAREFAYTLAVPIRLAPPPKPPVVKESALPPELALGPLPYVPRRVAGFLEYGGVSAILETGNLGSGEINIVQPGATVQSGIANIPPLTVESISSTEMILRAEDGRTARVSLSGVPGGVTVPNPGGGAGGPGGPPNFGPGGPGGFPGGPSGRGGFGGRGGGGRGAAVD